VEAGAGTENTSEEIVVTAALVAALVSLFVNGLGLWWNEVRYRRQHRAETAIKKLLTAKNWTQRSFKAIKRNIGGYDDDDLRRLLVRSGAIRLYRKSDNEEMWGLLSENKSQLEE
jgi:hypothetical protein